MIYQYRRGSIIFSVFNCIYALSGISELRGHSLHVRSDFTWICAETRLARTVLAAFQAPIVFMVMVRKPFQYLWKPVPNMRPHCGVGNVRIAAT
jgi:hypothetical protein